MLFISQKGLKKLLHFEQRGIVPFPPPKEYCGIKEESISGKGVKLIPKGIPVFRIRYSLLGIDSDEVRIKSVRDNFEFSLGEE